MPGKGSTLNKGRIAQYLGEWVTDQQDWAAKNVRYQNAFCN